ncbi:MAG TPA: hypothetical protein VGN26_23785 [Armatimonadota bacterium]|jgi:hypothetical protein
MMVLVIGCQKKVEAPLPFHTQSDTVQKGLRVLKVVVPRYQSNRESLKKLAQYLRNENPRQSLGINFYDDPKAAGKPVPFSDENSVPIKDEFYWLHYLAQYEYNAAAESERYIPLAPLDNP